MAYGLPVEGRDGPFLGAIVTDVPTCDVHSTVADARALLARAGPDATVIVLAAGGLAVGEVGRETLEGHADGHRLLDVMDPVPTTVRPSVTVASLAESGGGRQLVSTSDGRLLGQAEVEHGDHEGHDHEGHDHEHDDDQEAEFDRELALVMDAIEERFGDREPSEAELRTFLHDRLVAEGRSPEDADRFLDELDEGEGG
jgi:CBS domain-containing protein